MSVQECQRPGLWWTLTALVNRWLMPKVMPTVRSRATDPGRLSGCARWSPFHPGGPTPH